jgi:hypothetical protein
MVNIMRYNDTDMSFTLWRRILSTKFMDERGDVSGHDDRKRFRFPSCLSQEYQPLLRWWTTGGGSCPFRNLPIYRARGEFTVRPETTTQPSSLQKELEAIFHIWWTSMKLTYIIGIPQNGWNWETWQRAEQGSPALCTQTNCKCSASFVAGGRYNPSEILILIQAEDETLEELHILKSPTRKRGPEDIRWVYSSAKFNTYLDVSLEIFSQMST